MPSRMHSKIAKSSREGRRTTLARRSSNSHNEKWADKSPIWRHYTDGVATVVRSV